MNRFAALHKKRKDKPSQSFVQVQKRKKPEFVQMLEERGLTHTQAMRRAEEIVKERVLRSPRRKKSGTSRGTKRSLQLSRIRE